MAMRASHTGFVSLRRNTFGATFSMDPHGYPIPSHPQSNVTTTGTESHLEEAMPTADDER